MERDNDCNSDNAGFIFKYGEFIIAVLQQTGWIMRDVEIVHGPCNDTTEQLINKCIELGRV